MNIALWIVQGILALVFLMVGSMKVIRSKEQLATNMAWVEDFSTAQIRGIGILEILGALGLILPAVTNILPILTPLAGVGLALIMVGAAFTHSRRNESNMVPVNIVLLLLAAFVVYGRFILVPLG